MEEEREREKLCTSFACACAFSACRSIFWTIGKVNIFWQSRRNVRILFAVLFVCKLKVAPRVNIILLVFLGFSVGHFKIYFRCFKRTYCDFDSNMVVWDRQIGVRSQSNSFKFSKDAKNIESQKLQRAKALESIQCLLVYIWFDALIHRKEILYMLIKLHFVCFTAFSNANIRATRHTFTFNLPLVQSRLESHSYRVIYMCIYSIFTDSQHSHIAALDNRVLRMKQFPFECWVQMKCNH